MRSCLFCKWVKIFRGVLTVKTGWQNTCLDSRFAWCGVGLWLYLSHRCAFLPAAGCSRNATWNWKLSKIFHSVLVARNASHQVKLWAHWVAGSGRSFPVRWSHACRSWLTQRVRFLDPTAVPLPGKPAAALGPGRALSCPGEQVLLCKHKASSGERLHACFSITLCHFTSVLVLGFFSPLHWISASLLKYKR